MRSSRARGANAGSWIMPGLRLAPLRASFSNFVRGSSTVYCTVQYTVLSTEYSLVYVYFWEKEHGK